MADFDKYATALKSWEGGFACDPADAGGATNKGITIGTFQQYINPNATVNDLRNMTDAQWRLIAKGCFWDKCKADKINNQSVAELIVDWCFNSGVGMIKKVQGIVGTKADGVVGPLTLNAINNNPNQKRLHYLIKSARAAYFADCVKNRSQNLKFYDGWINRLAALEYGRSMEVHR